MKSILVFSTLIAFASALLKSLPWPQTISGGIGLSGSSRDVSMRIGTGFG